MLEPMDGGRENLFEWATSTVRDPDPHVQLRRLGAPARRALAAELGPDETVRVVVRGTRGQAIVGTDRRVPVLPPFVPGDDTAGPVPRREELHVIGVGVNQTAPGRAGLLGIL